MAKTYRRVDRGIIFTERIVPSQAIGLKRGIILICPFFDAMRIDFEEFEDKAMKQLMDEKLHLCVWVVRYPSKKAIFDSLQ